MSEPQEIALIVGAGPGLSSSIARLFARSGIGVALASRNPERQADLARAIDAHSFRCDVAEPAQVAQLFADVVRNVGVPDIVVFNPNFQVMAPITQLDPAAVMKALTIVTFGGFLVAQEAVKHMQPRGRGTLLFTGNPSSIKGRPRGALVAMSKGGLRGLAQSLARELHPANIHVATVIADASIDRHDPNDSRSTGPDSLLDPDQIAEGYLYLHRQARNCWSTELEMRPWSATF